jgi:uncharacterized membrane protein (UPF0127 family)
MNRIRTLAAVGLLAFAPAAFAQNGESFDTTKLTIGINIVHAEVAATPSQREQGLMFRKSLGVNDGMVFLFDEPQRVCMWMHNTLIPLSVAFIDADRKIVNVEEMKEETDDAHCAKRAVQFALEMNPGWFKKNHLKPGVKVEGLPDVK